MTEKKIDRKYSAFISCVLAFITLITSVPVIIAAQSPEKKLLISDCESGWTYYGNSQISYQQDGTEGKCLSVTGAYGVMRRISFVTEGCELSDYNRIEWDFRAVSAADGSDILTDVIDSYKQSISFTLYYNDGSYVNYTYNDMHITAAANGWYRFSVILAAGAGSLLTNVEICILDNNSFNTSLPETNFYIDSLYAVGSGVIDGPEIEGAQVDRDDCKMRILASVNKSEYENLKRNVSDCEFGFIVVNSDIYNGVINSGEYGADYVSGEPALIRSEQMYKYGDDAGRLYFTAVLSDFSSEEKRSMNISVRAWLSYIDEYGVKQTVYSNDGISGGYELSWNKINASNYYQIKNDLAKGLIEEFELAFNIDIKEYIEEMVVATPFTFKKFTNRSNGSIFGPMRLGYDNSINRLISYKEEGIPHLSFVGEASIFGGGLDNAIYSGYYITEQLLKEERRND